MFYHVVVFTLIFVTGTNGCKCTCDDPTEEPDNGILFEDNFESFNLNAWQHEITAGGGGNSEFQYYTNNRSNSWVRDGVLYIKPTLTEDKYDEEFVKYGNLNLEGTSPANLCTGRQWWGCDRTGQFDTADIINPIQSARLRTVNSFSFEHGRLEVIAQMPKGDWLWPAIWMLPKNNLYGDWPASGEMDLLESRGNMDLKSADGTELGVASVGTTLHWGPYWPHNAWYLTHNSMVLDEGTYGDDFHSYVMEKTSTSLKYYVDDVLILDATPPDGKSYWEWADWESIGDIDNPWATGSKMAPFDQEYYLILNVAVGGTTGFFPDDTQSDPAKPWSNSSPHPLKDFWLKKSDWYPTWKGEDAAMKIKSVRVTKL